MADNFLERNCTPRYFYNRITDITPEDIRRMGGRAIGIDLDNTCCTDSTYKLFPGVYNWVHNMISEGFPVMIISNTVPFRAKRFSEILGGIPYIGGCKKPCTDAFYKAAEQMKTDIGSLVMIGDQLFADIEGANNAGAVSVRVRYVKREILLGIRFALLRRRENKYLISKGLGDKI